VRISVDYNYKVCYSEVCYSEVHGLWPKVCYSEVTSVLIGSSSEIFTTPASKNNKDQIAYIYPLSRISTGVMKQSYIKVPHLITFSSLKDLIV
jgi:hypothetical protein